MIAALRGVSLDAGGVRNSGGGVSDGESLFPLPVSAAGFSSHSCPTYAFHTAATFMTVDR